MPLAGEFVGRAGFEAAEGWWPGMVVARMESSSSLRGG